MFFFFIARLFTSKWADSTHLLLIFLLFYLSLVIVSFIFTLCEPGAYMTNKFGLFNNELEQCKYYLLPIKMQKLYLIFSTDTQRPINLTSYGNILCDRDTSKRVSVTMYKHTQIPFWFSFHSIWYFQIINKVFSYFMAFRKFKP